jgi:uncharacterized membrane protein YphA (DoxX/SURF4 family)
MSQSIKDFERTGTAGEDMDTKQYYIVQQSATGDIEVGEGATDLLVGVLQNKPKSGEAALYRFAGTSKVVASAAIAIGAYVTTTALGKAVTTTTAGDVVIGRALEAAAADGDVIEIQLTHFRY